MSDRSLTIQEAIEHYPPSDRRLFEAGYTELTAGDPSRSRIIEVCCGEGGLAGWLAKTFPDSTIVGIDYWDVNVEAAQVKYSKYSNLEFYAGDVLNLNRFADESVDVVVGQATLHHLANNLPGAAREFARVLKPGGKCGFIFEPLGHNPLIAAVRAALNARREWIDESNLYIGALNDFGREFGRMEIQYFNLFGYAAKVLPAWKGLRWISDLTSGLDRTLFRLCPGAKKYAANFNVFYWK